MRRSIHILFLMITLQLSFPAAVNAQSEAEQLVVDEVLRDLRGNILPFWVKYSPDPSGGFYGTIRNNGMPVPQSSKGGVLNARILWTFSRAYRLFGDDTYKELADRAQHYFIRYFIDKEMGGAYWMVNADGSRADRAKQTYGIAYDIYGLAEHYRATGNEEILNQAVSLFHTLEKHAFDTVNGGYVESFNRDWSKPEKYGYDGSGVAPKTMNTHLHVLEAYSLLFQVWPDAALEMQLRGLINLFTKNILNKESWHQKLFLTMEWENLEEIDSYGHDVELSWLLYEAAEVLGDKELLGEIKTVALHLVDIQMAEGWNEELGYLNYERVNGQLISKIEWWPQAESVVAFYNAWQITQDEKYLAAAIRTWNFVKENLIDKEYGEWYSGLGADNKPVVNRPKADLWKCPYHNSRMGFELFVRSQQNYKNNEYE
ncbi:MAG: AGE family epimerase/isomerase [Mariniphaga sp.]|nr:AGE family epimerase/isomerase [Mariniphaga sp.]